MRDLANHSFEVAGPVLRRSKALDDKTLLQVVNHQSQNHVKASPNAMTSARPSLTPSSASATTTR